MNIVIHLLTLLSLVICGTALRISLSTWEVNVFSKGEAGYYCIKIPDLLQLANGKLLAFGEARTGSCADNAPTTLVYKESMDHGQTWGNIKTLYTEPGHTIGNAAPVQIHTGRILIPFCRDNREVHLIMSDNNGDTWSNPTDISSTTVDPSWKWVGTGPPASIQLKTGRILVPSYHTNIIHGDGEDSTGHVLVSDDNGATWSIGGLITSPHYHPNECQAVELYNGSVLVNSRSLGVHRLQAVSYDHGDTFLPPYQVRVPESVEGCEMSTINTGGFSPEGLDVLMLSGPTQASVTRQNMTIWTSSDAGGTWDPQASVDVGSSAYSALAVLANQTNPGAVNIGILFERAEKKEIVFVPDHISYRMVLMLK
eukprot:TRINITY_DN38492_c0_g1_i1.p1 TRINITY_DN38492_c0_g1~~TRINITY_DN38492_c0_g1_i1.p1  ORF type:complete len:389 (+),score=58.69 TRINITY_DN38492_c0_g1_i1:64-1167(+)